MVLPVVVVVGYCLWWWGGGSSGVLPVVMVLPVAVVGVGVLPVMVGWWW